jgi:ATP-binding cassette subfamily B protein
MTAGQGEAAGAERVPGGGGLRQFVEVFGYTRRAVELVWATSRQLTVLLGVLTVVAGVLPGGIAYVGKLIVDAVVALSREGAGASVEEALWLVAAEAGLVAVMAGVQRGLSVIQALLRAQLGHRVNVMILEKALELSLPQFEDSELYDKMTRARREASMRPLSLVNRVFGVIQSAISLVAYGALLVGFSGWAVLALVVASLPAFVAEARFSGDTFRLFRWRAPERRHAERTWRTCDRAGGLREGGQAVSGWGRCCWGATSRSSSKLYGGGSGADAEPRAGGGIALGLLSTAAFYGVYGWIAASAIWRRDHAGGDDDATCWCSSRGRRRSRRHLDRLIRRDVRGQPVSVEPL